MRPFGLEMIEQAHQVRGIVTERQRRRRVIARPIAAPIPGNSTEAVTKVGKLFLPVTPVATNAVQKDYQWATPHHVIRNCYRSCRPLCGAHTHSPASFSVFHRLFQCGNASLRLCINNFPRQY
jgi:hypothetical protein